MALVVKDRVKETTTTTGSTDAYNLAGAATGFQSFNAVLSNGDTTYYCCTDGDDFEVGLGTFTASGTTLSRDTVLESSNSGNKVNWGTGTRDVFITQPAEKAVFLDGSNNISIPGTIDGRDLATDGTKLDGIEASATADQTASEIRTLVESASDSNVFTDADHTKLNGIESNATADQTAAEIRTLVESATDSNVFTDADHTKLNGIEASADVTDTANVTAAGALMDSEVTNLSQVKAFDSSDFATAAQGSTADAAMPKAGGTFSSDVTFSSGVSAKFNSNGVAPAIDIDGGGPNFIRFRDNSSFSNTTNAVHIVYRTTPNDLLIERASGENIAEFGGDDGHAALYFNDSKKLETVSGGITVTGEVAATSLDISGDVDVDGTLEADAITLNGTALAASATTDTTNASNIGSGTLPNARLDAQLQDVAGLAVTNGNFIVGDGSNFVAESGSTARASLGLGTAAVLDTGISNTNVPKFTSGVADNDFLRVDGTAIEGRSASQVLSDIGGQASLTFGISNTNAVKIDSSSVADDEYARFTASGLESRSTSEVLSDIGGQAALTFGISNTNAVKIDSSSVADDEFARFTANGLESRSASEVRSDIGLGTIATQAADSVNIDGGAVDAITLGTNSAVTEAQIDNININGNTVTSTNTNGNIALTPNGTGVVQVDGSNGVSISEGAISIKNGGTQSYVDFYCESSNAHYARLQAPAHSAFAGNVTSTLPHVTGTLVGTANADAASTTTSSGDADHVLVNDGGVLKKITPANLGIPSDLDFGLITGSAASTDDFGAIT